MPQWAAFAGFVGVVLAALLFLARASANVLESESSPAPMADTRPDVSAPSTLSERVVGDAGKSAPDRRPRTPPTGALLVNVLVSQGLFASLLVVGAWYASIPATALGVGPAAVAARPLGVGVALGLALHVVNVVGTRMGERYGLGDSAALRRAMTPETGAGWAVLLLLVLPLVAGFEELLFRGVLVGAFATGFGVSPWLLAALSSVAFALGHGAQGRIGVAVTAALGFVLAAAFVVTGSLVTVVVAHYLVNALEFVTHRD